MILIGDLVHVGSVSTLMGTVEPLSGIVKHKDNEMIGIEFFIPISGGHDLNGHCKNGYGYYFNSNFVQRMEPFTPEMLNKWSKTLIKPKRIVKQESIIQLEE